MKRKSKIISVICATLLIALGLTMALTCFADGNDSASYTPDTDYTPVQMWSDGYSSAKGVTSSGNLSSYLTYLHDLGDGNKALAIAPGIEGVAGSHVYLSYRKDTAGADQILYVSKTGATSPEAACTTDFATLDIDLGTTKGIPDGMSIMLNGRYYTSETASSPKGNATLYLRDSNGRLEVSGTSATDGYVDTGIDLSKSFVHITLVLDLREVAAEGADTIKAYAYVNGKFMAVIKSNFSDDTDIINEVRVELLSGTTTAKASDTILLDNLNMRAFRTGEYTGNLGGVLLDSTKTLSEFDKNVFTQGYALPSPKEMNIAKIGTKSYTSYGDIIKDAKSGDTVRFLTVTGTRPTNLAASAITYVNASTGLQSDGVLYAAFDKSGALLKNYTSAADFSAAVQSLQIVGGTIELYGNVKSSAKIFTSTTANDGTVTKNTTTHAVFSLNGYTLSPAVGSWLDIASSHGIKKLEFVGPGSFTTTSSAMFAIGAGAVGSSVSFKDVDITVPDRLIIGQKGVYTFENCNIRWTSDGNNANSNLIHGFGGPIRGGEENRITFKNCYISTSRPNTTSNSTRGVLIATNTIANNANDNPGVSTIITIDSCEVDIANCYILFSNWNASHTAAGRPAPTLNIIDSNVTAYALASAYRGSRPVVTTEGNTVLDIKSLGTVSGTMEAVHGTYNSELEVNFSEGTVSSLKPASASGITLNLDGKLLALASGAGYIVENPTLKANISLGSDFDFNFYVPKDTFVSAKVDSTALTVGEEIDFDGVTYVKVTYEGIAPATAGVSRSTAFTLTNGHHEYIAKYSASIPKYIKSVQSGTDDAAARSKTIIAATVRYIDSAYTYFGKTDGKDAIAELLTLTADVSVPSLSFDALTAVNTMASVSNAVSEATLALESSPTVRFILNPEFSGEITVGGENYTVSGGMCDNLSYIDVPLSAKNIMSAVTVKVGADVGKFNTVSYYNYLKSVSASDADAAAAVPVVEALFTYGACAGEYVDHVFEDEWSYNGTHHWHACADKSCIITADRAEHEFDDDGFCICGQVILLEDGEGEFLQALGIDKNVKTDLSSMEFAKVLENTSVSYSFTAEEKSGAAIGDMLLFSFVVKADKSTPIDITVDVGTKINYQNSTKTMTYHVPVQWTRIYMPIENAGMASVTLKTSGKVYIAEAKYENRADATQDDLQLESGMWMLDEFEYYDVSGAGIGAGSTIDLIRGGDYIYSIGDKKLTVTDTRTDKVVSTLSGFDSLRQIDITDDEKYVVMTGRQDGVYIVNVENPAAPAIVSTYNSIEMATGLYISGNYAFICNRQYGVEVVDISVPENPKHLINIHSGEVQSCVVYNNILYAGVWGECGVFMYDLSTITDSSRIEMIGKITTNGKGDGMSILERDGRVYLFAATGQHTYGAPTSSPLDNLCYGQGNGLDIFDVTDPAAPVRLSNVRIDGRYYYTANDYWESEVGYDEQSGRYYAYLVNTYNGIYVYDVTDIEAPVRVAHIDIPRPLGSTTPALKHDTRKIITTWNQYESRRGPVGDIIIEDGKLYIAGAETDIHVLENDSFIFGHENGNKNTASFDNLKDNFYDFDNVLTGGIVASLASGSYALYDTDGQVLGVATSGSYVYVAAGKDGIKVLDKATLECVKTIAPTSVGGRVGFANGIKVYGGKLYVAEDVAGLRVYDISGDYAASPAFLWSYRQDARIAREVVISPDGIFSLVAYGSNGLWVINNETHALVKTFSTSGTMYHHNVSPVIADRYVCISGHSGDENWIDFGPAGARLENPTSVRFTGGLGMTNGITNITVDGVEYALKITSSKGVYTNDFTKNTGTTVAGISALGKPTVCGNYLFVAERISSVVKVYDISCLTDESSTATAATLIGTFTFDGNPDIIHADGTTVYIPLGYQGMLVIDTATAFGGNA
ncbi:MAG: hypothetical protein IJD79_02220 [Clostridia bacterium]|nr:hypothetical protein [Clostridia bacterium]